MATSKGLYLPVKAEDGLRDLERRQVYTDEDGYAAPGSIGFTLSVLPEAMVIIVGGPDAGESVRHGFRRRCALSDRHPKLGLIDASWEIAPDYLFNAWCHGSTAS